MREIKFRAKHQKTGEWWYGSLDVLYHGYKQYRVYHLSEFWRYVRLGILALETIGQYTGLKDKNGKESYFDDVCKWRDSTFLIAWDELCATVILKRLSGNDGMKEIPAHNIPQSEVIGNIYENPEEEKCQ